MELEQIATRIAGGAAAGLAATGVMHRLRRISQKTVPQANPPTRQDPGQFMVRQAESALSPTARQSVPAGVEQAAAQTLRLGYGMTFGALYAAVRPRGGNPLVEGIALGLATWAVGYLGWLPATGLTPPPTRQTPLQLLGPIVTHALFGIAAVAAFDAARRLLDSAGLATA